MPVIGKNLRETIQAVADVSGMDHFFVQDTETTGLDERSQIYEIAGIEYDHGVIRKVHYFLDRPDGVSYDVLKKTVTKGGKTPWANIISDKDFEALKSGKISNYNGGVYLSNKDAAKFVKNISQIPNITYNAVFDIDMEMRLDKTIKFNHIYDAATLVLNTFPQILQLEDIDDHNKTGHWNLQLIYKYLQNSTNRKELGLKKSFPTGYGGKVLKNEEHTAYSDTVNMLLPVLGVIAEIFKQPEHKHWKWDVFKNKQAVSTYYADKNKAQYKRANLEMMVFSPDILKKIGKNAQGFLTIDKKSIGGTIVDVDQLLKFLPSDIQTAENLFNRVSTGSNTHNSKALKSLMQDIGPHGQYNTGHLLHTLDTALRNKGFNVTYNYKDPSNGALEVVLIPQDDAFLIQMANHKVQPITFQLNLTRPDGLINLDGRKAINKLFSDYQNGKTIVITAEQAQLIDVIQYISSGRIDGLIRQGKYDLIGKRISSEIRQAMHTLHTAQNFVSNDMKNEEGKDLSGTGTARQRWIRENYLDNSRFLTHLVEHDKDALIRECLRAGFPGIRTKDAAFARVVNDLNDILNIVGTLSIKSAEHELIKQQKRFGYLTGSDVWFNIKKNLSSLGILKFHPGISSESSVAHMTVSLLSAESLTPAGMTRLDTRHQPQVANTRALTHVSKTYRESVKRQGRIFNEIEINQPSISRMSVQDSLASYAYITQDDINRAYKKVRANHNNLSSSEFIRIYGSGNVGIHNDSSVFRLNSNFQTQYLDSYNKTTKTIDRGEFLYSLYYAIIGRVQHNTNLSKYSVLELENMLENGQSGEFERILSRMSLDDREKLKNNVAKGCIYRELNTSNLNYKNITVENVNEVGSKYRVTVYLPAKMESGTKILSKIDGLRTNAQGINEEVYLEILFAKGLLTQSEYNEVKKSFTIIYDSSASESSRKNAKSVIESHLGKVDLFKELPTTDFSSEDMEGLIIGYLNKVVSTVINKSLATTTKKNQKISNAAATILNIMNKDTFVQGDTTIINAFKGFMRWDNNKRSFVVKEGFLSNAMCTHKLDGILSALNRLGAELSIPEGFVKISSGVWTPSSKYIGMSAINQAQVDEYGDPRLSPHGVVKYDYRAINSIESAVALARGSKSKSLRGIEGYIKGQMYTSSEDLKKYKKISVDIDKANQMSLMSGLQSFGNSDMQARKSKAVSVGYGSGYDVDISKWEMDLFDENSKFSQSLYNDSLFKKIEDAKKVKAKALGIKPDSVEVYLDLEQTYAKVDRFNNGAGKGAAVRYLFLPKLSPLSDDWENMEFPDMPSYVQQFKTVVSGIKRIHEIGNVGISDRVLQGIHECIEGGVFGFIEQSSDVVRYKESSIWQSGNTRRVAHSGNAIATSGNASWIFDKDATALQKRIASTDGVMNFDDAIAIIKQDETLERDSKKTLVKKRLGHLGVLRANVEYLWEGNSKSDIQKHLANAISDYVLSHMKYKEGLTPTEIKAKQNKILNSAETVELRHNIMIALGFESGDLTSIATGVKSKEYNEVNSFLANFIADSVTVGSVLMESRVHQDRALQAILGRYPFSNGLDLKFSQLYIDKGVVRGRITVGLGVGRSFNLDYDGDHVPYWLNMLSTQGLGSSDASIHKKWQKKAKEFEALQLWQRKITSFLAITEAAGITSAIEPQVYKDLESLKKDNKAKREGVVYYTVLEGTAYKWDPSSAQFIPTRGYITQEKVNELFQFQEQVKAVLAGRKYKNQTGSLSNIYQAVANAMHERGFDEMGLASKDPVQKERAMRGLILRAFYESLTQDAISSKKVFNRLKERGKTTDSFLWELSDLIESLKQSSTYTEAGLRKLFNHLNDMGLSTIQDRILVQVLVTARTIDKTGKTFEQIFGIKAKDFKLEYNSDGTIKSLNGLDFDNEHREAAISVVKGLIDKKTGVFASGTLIQKVMLDANNDFNYAGLGGIAQVINNVDAKIAHGAHQTGLSDYALPVDQLMESATEFTQKVVTKRWHEIEKEQRSLSNRQYKPLTNSKNVKFEKSIAEFRQSIVEFGDTTKKIQQYSIFAISVGLDTTNGKHATYINSGDYVDDPETLSFLNQLIKDNKVYSVTQFAGVLHIGDFKNSSTYATAFGTMIHSIIERIRSPRDGHFEDKKLAEAFQNVTANPAAASEALKEWIQYQWDHGNEEDKTNVMVAFEDGHIIPFEFNKALQEVSGFVEQIYSLGYDDLFADTEYTRGIVVRNGTDSFIISGTIDQLWHMVQESKANYELSDFKTSKYPYLEYVIQVSLYNAILRASGLDVNKYGRLLINNESGSSIVEVESLSNDQLFKFITDALPILQCTDPNQRKVLVMKLVNKWNPLLMNQMTLEITQKADKSGFLFGGSTGGNLLFYLGREFPLTQQEVALRVSYQNAKKNKEKHTGSLEEFIGYQYRKGLISKELYQAHLKFRGYRAQIIENYIGRYGSQAAQNTVREFLLKSGKNDIYEISIASDYYAAYNGASKVKFVNINEYQSSFNIDENTYIYHGDSKVFGALGFNKGGEDDMAVAQDIAQAILNALQPYINGKGSSASGGNSNGSGSGASINPDALVNKYSFYTRPEDLASEYARQLHLKEKEQAAISLLTNEDEKAIAQKKWNEKYLGEGITFADGTQYGGILSVLENAMRTVLVQQGVNKGMLIGDAEAAANVAMPGELEKATKLKEENLEYTKEMNDIQTKIDERDQKILEQKKKLYGELLVLQTKLNIAKRSGNEEDIEAAQALYNAKEKEYNEAGHLTEAQEKEVVYEKQEKIHKLEKADLDDKERRYKALIRERETLNKQLYKNTEAQKLTYDPQQRRALKDEYEVLMEQWNNSESAIMGFRNTYGNDPEIGNIMSRVDSISTDKMARDMAGIDVSNKGNHTLWGQLGSQMTNLFARFTQMGAAYKIIGQIRQSISQVVSAAKELDKSLTNLRIVTGANTSEAQQMLKTYAQLGDKLGATTTEVANSAQEWLRQGYEMNEVTELVTASIYLSKLGMMDASTATKDLTNI